MSTFVVIDTETTWTDDVMSIGAVIADSKNYSIIDSRYYLIDPAYRYYVASRQFELPELKLLVDAVQSSRFITERKSRDLIEKLETLCS